MAVDTSNLKWVAALVPRIPLAVVKHAIMPFLEESVCLIFKLPKEFGQFIIEDNHLVIPVSETDKMRIGPIANMSYGKKGDYKMAIEGTLVNGAWFAMWYNMGDEDCPRICFRTTIAFAGDISRRLFPYVGDKWLHLDWSLWLVKEQETREIIGFYETGDLEYDSAKKENEDWRENRTRMLSRFVPRNRLNLAIKPSH